MKLAIDIVQSLLLPKLEKDAIFDINQANIAFWETFTTAFLDFEKDAKPVYAAIYSLGLKDAEKIISKLDTVYISFIKELAENHVLGISSEAIDYLITSKNSTFEKEVRFFTDLQNAIKKVERKRIKTELPNAFDKLSFQLSDDAIALAITKKEREALKEKMNAWDEQLVISEEAPVYSVSTKKEPKVFSLSWIKYAAAACIVLTAGIMYFKFNTDNNVVQPGDTNVVTAPVKKETITPEIPSEALAEVTTVTKTATVVKSGLGFAPTSSKIKIVENNQAARKISIEKAIEKYRQMLEQEFPENKLGYGSRAKAIQDTITSLQKELVLLNEKEKQYIFDGKALVLYVSVTAKENAIVLYDETYYFKRDADFFKLTVAKQPQLYKKITDLDLLEVLNNLCDE
ncbi:hypothetical protein [Flavobacterium aciduliphilum]|uniref:Uncharacterized protein n=1 Tax=Flavobacterium aciduliphilum TaxID=1101402 RepID=A0A328YEC1_9FLAO|nr:hypothetical protein [Flavobacterium aciduliphilum]RAR71493.1 hypothetical protein CLV55_10749 [Flavobacterium aciduliphilum]